MSLTSDLLQEIAEGIRHYLPTAPVFVYVESSLLSDQAIKQLNTMLDKINAERDALEQRSEP